MVRSKLVYIALVIGLVCFYVLYIDSLALLMLLCVLIAPIFLRIGLLWLRITAECHLKCSAPSCKEGDSIPVTFILESHCPLFFPRAEADVVVKHIFSQEQELLHLKFPVQPENNTRLTFYIQPAYCGAVEIHLKRLYVYDLFRLFRTKIRSDQEAATLLVLPEPIALPLEETAPPVDQPESERFADKPGDDPSELFGIREYLPGDPVSRIHWKLSSRSDTLLLKEFGFPIEKNMLVFVEYHPQKTISDAQALLTLFYSLAWQLIQEAHLCELAWYDESQKQILFCQPDSESALEDAFRRLYSALLRTETDTEILQDAFSGRRYSSATVISNRAEQPLLDALEQGILANQKNLLVISKETVPLRSDLADVQYIHPDTVSPERLIV